MWRENCSHVINGIFSQPWVTTSKVSILRQTDFQLQLFFPDSININIITQYGTRHHCYIKVTGEVKEVLEDVRMQRNTILEMTKRKTIYLKTALTIEQNWQARGQKPVLNLTLFKHPHFIHMHMCTGWKRKPVSLWCADPEGGYSIHNILLATAWKDPLSS